MSVADLSVLSTDEEEAHVYHAALESRGRGLIGRRNAEIDAALRERVIHALEMQAYESRLAATQIQAAWRGCMHRRFADELRVSAFGLNQWRARRRIHAFTAASKHAERAASLKAARMSMARAEAPKSPQKTHVLCLSLNVAPPLLPYVQNFI